MPVGSEYQEGFHKGDFIQWPSSVYIPLGPSSILVLSSHRPSMDYKEKAGESTSVATSDSANQHPQFYDPSKESIWTRLGLNAESFKRAPGTTG